MVLLVLAFLLILISLYNAKVFIYSLMVFFVMFDMFDGFYDDQKFFAAMRYIIPLFLLLFFIFRESILKKSDFIFLILGLYLLILLVYSPGDIIVSSKTLLSIFLTFLMIPVGRFIGSHVNFLQDFEGYNRLLLIILPAYILFANVFGIGESYSTSFTSGFLVTSRMYIFPIVTFLAIHYLVANKDRSWVIKGTDFLFIAINIGIIMINARRTAMGMLIVALLVYVILNRKIALKMIAFGLVLTLALILSYPLYEQTLTAQLEKRERIQNIENYEEEGRYLETLYIFDYHSHRQNMFEILFGVSLFDTHEFGVQYFGRDRPIHSDLNMIFFSTGIFGMLLFAYFFLHYFFFGNRKIMLQNKKVYYPLLIMFLIILIPGRFIGTLTYAPLLMLILAAVKAGRPLELAPPPVENELNTSLLNEKKSILSINQIRI